MESNQQPLDEILESQMVGADPIASGDSLEESILAIANESDPTGDREMENLDNIATSGEITTNSPPANLDDIVTIGEITSNSPLANLDNDDIATIGEITSNSSPVNNDNIAPIGEITSNSSLANLDNDDIATIGEITSNSQPEIPVIPIKLKPDLKVRFDRIDLPDTVDFGDVGNARVTVTNGGNRAINGPVSVNLIVSTDETIDRITPTTLVDAQDDLKNDGLLATVTQQVKLQPGKSTTFDIPYKNLTSVVSPGAYRLIAEVDPLNQISESNEGNNITSRLVSAPGTDVVIDWMSTFLNAVQEDPESGDPVGSAPPEGSRAMALLSAAIYDTVNAFDRTHTPYLVDRVAPTDASLEAAVAGAAHYVLKEFYPSEATPINFQLGRSMAEAAGTPVQKANGFNFGRSIAQAVMASPQATALSVSDPDLGYPYTPATGDYVWHPDLPNKYALGAGYGKDAITFAVPDKDTFRPTLDGVYKSDRYAQDIEEVRKVGGRENTATTTINRTPDQTQLTYFWAYDRPDTFRPYGQLVEIAQETAVREGNTIADNARLFLQLGVALADSVITAWDAKYTELQPRPDDVIAGRIDEVTGLPVAPLAATDGRPDTIADPDWKSLLPTPPFPDFISGHSIMGGAFGAVMTDFFGDNYQFTAVSQELIGTTRTFSSFNQAGFEDAISRLYAGVHVREAITDAVDTGQAIANYVVGNIAQPLA